MNNTPEIPLSQEELENLEIEREYMGLIAAAKPYIHREDEPTIRKAFEMAQEAHKNMRRKSGEPYILHPIAVARIIVSEIGMGTEAIIAALLHDVVEDTDLTLEDIEKHFSKNIARLVDGLTKIKGLTHIASEVAKQAENLKKVILTLNDDYRVVVIKIADRLHNMRTLNSMSQLKQVRIASETLYLYAPLAHRLGLYAIKTELEDLSLKYTNPEIYKDIAQKLAQTKRDRDRYIQDFITPLSNKLTEHKLPPFRIFGRPKSIHSIWNKLRNKEVAFEDIYDLFAIRIVVDVPEEIERDECWKAYSVATAMYKPNPERTRDWITFPRTNGYMSLHCTVMGPEGRWVEVQIRSERMDMIAEKGVAAHWKYKGGKGEKGLDEWLERVRDSLQNMANANALDLMNDFKHNLYEREVHVFTPKGDLRVMQAGSTIIDFAYEIHTQIGNTCIGGKINGKLYPISQKLQNGDQVEILTSKKQKPSEDWLSFAVTSRARQRIRSYLKESIRQEAQNGKETFERKLRALKLQYSEQLVNELVNYFKQGDSQTFFYNIATEQFDLNELRNLTFMGGKIKLLTPNRKSNGDDATGESNNYDVANAINNDVAINREVDLLIFGGLDKIDYAAATCCQPQAGDDVFGFITITQGIKIHKNSCPNAPDLRKKYPYRIVTAKWHQQSNDVAFLTGLRITGIDDVGLIQRLTNVISVELKKNMQSIAFTTKDGLFEGSLTLYMKDSADLKQVIKRLREVEGVHEVRTFEA